MKILTLLFICIFSNAYAENSKTFSCQPYLNGISRDLKNEANFKEITVTADWLKGGLGKAPAKNVKITTAKEWKIDKLAEIRPIHEKLANKINVTHDDGTTYFTDVVLTTTPYGNISFITAELGVLLTEKGPQEILFKTTGQKQDDYFGSSFAGFRLNCKELK